MHTSAAKIARTFTVSVSLCLAGCIAGAYAESQQILPLTEAHLTAYQTEQMSTDYPLTDVLLGQDHSAWFLGKTSLWKWTPAENRLQRISIGASTRDGQPLRALAASGAKLFTADDHNLFELTFNPQATRTYPYPNSEQGHTIDLSLVGNQVLWIHQDGLVRLNGDLQEPMIVGPRSKLQSDDIAQFDIATNNLWIARGANLLVRNLGAKAKKSQLIFKANEEIKALQMIGSEVYVQTPNAVLRFGTNGKLLQAIAVSGNRKLKDMNVNQEAHSYLFDDGLVEFYTLADKTTRRYTLPMSLVKEAQTFAAGGKLVALISAGQAHLFQAAE